MRHEGAPAEIDVIGRFLAPATDNFEYIADDKPQDECGVFALYAPGQPIADITLDALKRLQHRGQNGAGIAFNLEPGLLWWQKDKGSVEQSIPDLLPRSDSKNVIDACQSDVIIGHTRYPTAESNDAAQPYVTKDRSFGLAHNGHIETINVLAELFHTDISDSVSDSEGLTRILHQQEKQLGGLDAAVAAVMPHIEGAYCLTITDGNRIMAIRDPWGTHPLSLGKLTDNRGYMVASETTAFKFAGVESIRDIEPGEIVVIDEDGEHSSHINRTEVPAHCMFEYIYFARPESIVNGVRVAMARLHMGRKLAEDYPIDADIVVGIPNSGMYAADGYSEASGLPLARGAIVKNDNVNRTFIERANRRSQALREKFDVLPELIEGQRVILVDDSVIKGNTMNQLVTMFREEGGASEVHVVSAAPQYKYGCYGGMDTRQTENLIARNNSLPGIAGKIGADSIAFNTLERVAEAIDAADPRKTAKNIGAKLCTACVTGQYPYKVPGQLMRDNDLLSLVDMAQAATR
jgi:amidophosphoribosyltransferase